MDRCCKPRIELPSGVVDPDWPSLDDDLVQHDVEGVGAVEVVALALNISMRLSVTCAWASLLRRGGLRGGERVAFVEQQRHRPVVRQLHGFSRLWTSAVNTQSQMKRQVASHSRLRSAAAPLSPPRSAKASAAAAISCTSRRPLGKVGVDPGCPFFVSVGRGGVGVEDVWRERPAMPAGMVDGCWFLRSPQAHWNDQPGHFALLAAFFTNLGVDSASATTAFALFATELALCGRSSLLLDFE